MARRGPWGSLGGPLGVLGRPLGVHGAPLGVPGAPLGRPYAHRGGPVSVLSALLGAPERPPGARGGEKAAVAAVPLSFSKMLLFPPWGALGRPWGVLGRLWGALGVSESALGRLWGAPGVPLGGPCGLPGPQKLGGPYRKSRKSKSVRPRGLSIGLSKD